MNEELSQAISRYRPSEETIQYAIDHPSLNLAGPTGAGKSTLTYYLSSNGNYGLVVSDTTRHPRANGLRNEVNGVDYWFIDDAQALSNIKQGTYLEIKKVHNTSAYGTSINAYKAIASSGRTPILDIDVQGMEELMRHIDSFEVNFLLPPSFEVWLSRLDSRGNMQLEDKLRRFESALIEISKPFNNPRFHPIINNEVADTAEVIRSGRYKQADYREMALKIARELIDRAKEFIDQSSTH